MFRLEFVALDGGIINLVQLIFPSEESCPKERVRGRKKKKKKTNTIFFFFFFSLSLHVTIHASSQLVRNVLRV